MMKTGCTVNGTLDDSKFNEPMPWIGLYVVAASSACSLAMAIDAFHGFRLKKYWFPCKFFALNATTLTLIAVAVKLSVDLNTSMPKQHDQLAKLSSTAFICTAIGNFMPSLGTMETKELMMNVVALGILVVTVIFNIFIQLGTGVIYVFWIEHLILIFLLVVLFGILMSSSLAMPTTKCYLDLKYKKMYRIAKKECDNNVNKCIKRKLRDDLTRYWMMAHTCNPQFVMGRLATCTASGAFCLLCAVTFAEAWLRSYLLPWCFKFCEGESDYKWSNVLILISQAIAVGVGTIAPASRWFTAIKFRCPKKMRKVLVYEFSVEQYWIRILCELKEFPLNVRVCGRHSRKFVHCLKNKVLDLCILCQKGTVLLSKFVRLLSILLVSRFLIIGYYCKKLAILLRCNKFFDTESESTRSGELDLSNLSNYVLHLEGEEGLIDIVMSCQRNGIRHCFRMGRNEQSKSLIQLLEKINNIKGFEGVQKFDKEEVPSLDSEEPLNCWALPVATLTSIAIAISTNDLTPTKTLIKSVNEGLRYIKVVEKQLDMKRDLINIRKAAEVVWLGIDLHERWLDVNLHKMAVQEKSPKEIISELSDIAKQKFMELRTSDVISSFRDSPSKWPVKVLAANAMYRICQTLLLTNDMSSQCREVMLERISSIIGDIMGACLTNLPHAISTKCQQSKIEEREDGVRSAIILLGKTEKILEILSCHPLPSSNPEDLGCINDWRALSRKKDQQCCSSSPTTNSESDFSTSPDYYLNID